MHKRRVFEEIEEKKKLKEEEEERVTRENKEKDAEAAVDGYNPTFVIDIDAIMNGMNAEMDSITLGGKEDKEKEKEKEKKKVRELEKVEVPQFRPLSEIIVDESQFWTSDSYKNDLIAEVREDLTRGLKVLVVVEAVAPNTELKSLLHSIFHEDEIKRNCKAVGIAGGSGFEYMNVPKVVFNRLDEDVLKASMVLHPAK